MQNFQILTCLCSLAVCFVYDLVANPKNILFRYEAQFNFIKISVICEIFHLAMASYRVYYDDLQHSDSLVVSSDFRRGGGGGVHL